MFYNLSFLRTFMELPVRAPVGEDQKIRYQIKIKGLTYRLSREDDEFSWFFWCKKPNNARCILMNVCCEAKAGEITAIAGPSGAGKTTLLEILAGIIPPNRVSGQVLINDYPMDTGHFRRLSGYVAQDEALFPLLTVEETLMYSARLRLHGGFKKAMARVHELLKELGLDHVAGSRIGDESSRGISGGEKRRVSIGIELVHNPAVLLIDEPTSGLDSASAFHVVLLLKAMATRQGKTIVLTIHQPGFRILELIDQIVLLADGVVRHHGSLNLLEERLMFAGHSIPAHVNVLEFAIDETKSLVSDTESKDNFELNYEQFIVPSPEGITGKYISFPNSQLKEIWILGQRFSSNIFRTKQLFAARIVQSIVAGFVLGTIFVNANNDQMRTTLQTQIGFFAFCLTFLLSSTTEGLPIFLEERRILMKETSRGACRISSYVLANTLVFVPFLLVVALLFSTPVYWLVGLQRDIAGFLYFSLVVWLVMLSSNSFVASFSALVPNFIVGTTLMAGLMGSFFLFSGYFISKEDIPKYWIFMHYLSLFKYPLECFLINEYGGEKGKIKCLASAEGGCILNGNEFLVRQGLEMSQKWSNIGVMLSFIFGYRLVCFLILWYRTYRIRS